MQSNLSFQILSTFLCTRYLKEILKETCWTKTSLKIEVRLFLQYFDKMGYSTRIFWLSMESNHRQTFFKKNSKKRETQLSLQMACLKYLFFLRWLKKTDKSSVYEIQKHYQWTRAQRFSLTANIDMTFGVGSCWWTTV